jgi:hypothetical protein
VRGYNGKQSPCSSAPCAGSAEFFAIVFDNVSYYSNSGPSTTTTYSSYNPPSNTTTPDSHAAVTAELVLFPNGSFVISILDADDTSYDTDVVSIGFRSAEDQYLGYESVHYGDAIPTSLLVHARGTSSARS